MNKELIVYRDNVSYLSEGAEFDLNTLEHEIKRLTELRDNIKNNLLEEMEKREIIRLESDTVTVTRLLPTTRETFDSKKFREDNPELYDEYVKFTPVKSSLRVKVK